tara:strand:+ start:1217 stop:1744 length:528 start_codon:yes stop_codon:yes gene_type:complete
VAKTNKKLLEKAEKIREALRTIDNATGLRTAWTGNSQSEVAEFFGMSIDTVANWAKRGMPGKRGTYRLDVIAQWLRNEGPWKRYETKNDDPLLVDDGESDALERYRLAKAKHAELDLDERRGELVDTGKHRDILSRWAQILRQFGERLGKSHGSDAAMSFNDTLEECDRILEDWK